MKQLFAFFSTLIIMLFTTITLISCEKKAEIKDKVAIEDKSILPPKKPSIDYSKSLKEDVLLDYTTKASTIQPNYKNGVPFDKLDYDKIIAYDFEGSEEPYPSVIDKQGNFVPTILAQKALSQIQADKILSTLTKKSTYGEGTAACFIPHFALVFYRNNKKVNQINICLDCNYLISEINIPAEKHLKVNRGTEEEYALIGFTKSGKSEIIKLCKELKFYYERARN